MIESMTYFLSSTMRIKECLLGAVGSQVTIYALVGYVEQKESIDKSDPSIKKPYVDLILEDSDDYIEAKMWQTTLDSVPFMKLGDIIVIRGNISEFKGKKQITLSNGRALKEEEQQKINRDRYLRTAPYEALDMYNFLYEKVTNFENPHFKNIGLRILNDYKEKLLYYPAAMKVHHNIHAGLLYHIYRIVQMIEKLVVVYSGVNEELLLLAAIAHDIGKIEELNSNELGKVSDFSVEGKLLGHLIQGVTYIHTICLDLNIPKEISTVLEHLIASHHGKIEYESLKVPMIKEAELLSLLDLLDARVYMYDEITKNMDKGEFSEKNFYLGNVQVYNPNI